MPPEGIVYSSGVTVNHPLVATSGIASLIYRSKYLFKDIHGASNRGFLGGFRSFPGVVRHYEKCGTNGNALKTIWRRGDLFNLR